MTRVTFIATTITSKGTFYKGDSIEFPASEAKDLQKLCSVESPTPTVKKTPKKEKSEEK